MPNSHDTLLTRLLAGVLVAIALQGLCIHAFSMANALEWSWTGTAVLLVGVIAWCARQWRQATPDARASIASAWRWPAPWVIMALLLAQIAIYPPSMADSQCYRLPRLFLALQDGGIGRFETPDTRMNVMPWGWEMMALPFASLNLLPWSRLINLATWLVIYQMLHAWAYQSLKERGRLAHIPSTSPSRASWAALALATAPVMLLQASSTANDLYAGGLLLVGVWMIRHFHANPGPMPVMGSLLALILAANVKPQFLVLGLPWLVWWAFAAGAPWRRVPWWGLAAAFPIYLVLSPLPLLAINYHTGGNLLGASEGSAIMADAPGWRMAIAGAVQFAATQLQLPLLPGADAISKTIQNLPGFEAIGQGGPKFNPGVGLMPGIDGASYGLLHFALITSGFVLALKNGTPRG